MLDNQQVITVDGTERTYTQSWDQEFAKDIASGSATVRKSPITNGNSILKIANAETKGVERHQAMLRDKTVTATEQTHEQVQLIVTHKADDPASALRAEKLAIALCDKIKTTGFATRLLAGEM